VYYMPADDAVRHAALCADRERRRCFTVYQLAGTFYVARSDEPKPQDATIHCTAQHWSHDTVQLRFAGARSEWIKF
jgi:hypothetical protein